MTKGMGMSGITRPAMGRRQALALGAAAAGAWGLPAGAQDAATSAVRELVARATGGTAPRPGLLSLTAPQVSENGQAVAIELSCPGAVELRVIAPANPFPEICTLRLPGALPPARIATRIRLAESQEIIALARLADGSWHEARAHVTLETAGCVG